MKNLIVEEKSPGESLKEFIRAIMGNRDKGLTVQYDEVNDMFILRYVFKMGDKEYLGKIPLSREEAHGLAEHILSR